MFEVVKKENGMNILIDIEENRFIRDLRASTYECMKIYGLSMSELAIELGTDSVAIERFLQADHTIYGELPRKICTFFQLDESDYLPMYFQDSNNKMIHGKSSESKSGNPTKDVLMKLFKVAVVIAVLKWVRWKVKSDPEVHTMVSDVIGSGSGASVIQSLSITLMTIGICIIGFGIAVKGKSFFTSKWFWIILGAFIIDAVVAYSFPDVPLQFLR